MLLYIRDTKAFIGEEKPKAWRIRMQSSFENPPEIID